MTLPASGQITMAQVNAELGRPTNSMLGLGDTAVRNLAGRPSGQISMADLHGKPASASAIVYIHLENKPGNDDNDFVVSWGYERTAPYSYGNISTTNSPWGTVTTIIKTYHEDEYGTWGWQMEMCFAAVPAVNNITISTGGQTIPLTKWSVNNRWFIGPITQGQNGLIFQGGNGTAHNVNYL